MMVSIIIIVKNDRRIQNLLYALQVQIKRNPHLTFEILVIDASEGRLDDIKNTTPFAKWINFVYKGEKKITIPEQRNLGIKKAKGEFIIFIDSDCIPENEWLTEIITPLQSEQEDIVAGKVIFSDKHSSHHIEVEKNIDRKYLDEAPTMNLAIKSKIFNIIGEFDTDFSCGEDVDFLWRARKAGFKIRSNPQAVIYHDQGNIVNELRRMYVYGKARPKLYRKHAYRYKFFLGNDLLTILYPIYLFFIPFAFIFPTYLLISVIIIAKYIRNHPERLILFKIMYGSGVLKELVFPTRIRK